jgi:hypothetical protein
MKIYNQHDEYQNYPEPNPLQVYYFDQAPDGDVEPWASMPIGSVSILTTAGSVAWYIKTVDNNADADWRQMNSATSRTGFIHLPLSLWREVSSNDIPAISDGPLASDPDGFGGLLAKNTTPNYEVVNGDTDGQLRLEFAANNVTPIIQSFVLPPDFDTASDMLVYFRGESAGTTNVTTVFSLDTYFNEGDTKLEDDTSAFTAAVVNAFATVAEADIPSDAKVCTIEATLGAHANDSIYIYGSWIQYTRL